MVSVVIPMYNSARFISQTLESLLAQTLKNFEVVIVDDCSTDNSVEVVEGFMDKFAAEGIRLHLIGLPTNSGTPGLPRNIGIQLAHGKYIAFLDSDDFFSKTALEELTTLAEEHQADVVKLGANFVLWNGQVKNENDPAFTDMNELLNPKNFSLLVHRKEKLTQPALEPDSLAERVNRWINLNSYWAICLTFCRRDFLITNQILFPKWKLFEDAPFTFKTFCLAKRYLNVPNVTYIVRPRAGSASRHVTTQESFSKDVHILIDSFKEFGQIMELFPFFKTHIDYRYAVLDWVAFAKLISILGVYQHNPPFVLNQFVEKEFHSDEAALASWLFNTVNIQRLHIMHLQQELEKLRQKK